MKNNEDFDITQEIENINNAFSQANIKEQKTSIFKKWWFWVIISVLATALIVGGTGDSDDNSDSGVSQSGGSTTPSISWKNSGTYKVGVDIDAGEYFIKCTSYNCYVQVSSDSTGSLNSIIANDNISTHTYITVRDGEYLTVTGGKFVLSSKVGAVEPSSDGTYGEGMYKVGKDIPAGEYKIVATNSCYIEVSDSSNHTLHSIVSNDNIDVGTSTYITVSNGQYLKVKRGKIHPQ